MTYPITYIDEVALRIADEMKDDDISDEYMRLYRIYAVLALAVGQSVSAENVHDAWSAWRVDTDPEHRSIVPFRELDPVIQSYDDPYADAIRVVARDLRGLPRYP